MNGTWPTSFSNRNCFGNFISAVWLLAVSYFSNEFILKITLIKMCASHDCAYYITIAILVIFLLDRPPRYWVGLKSQKNISTFRSYSGFCFGKDSDNIIKYNKSSLGLGSGRPVVTTDFREGDTYSINIKIF